MSTSLILSLNIEVTQPVLNIGTHHVNTPMKTMGIFLEGSNSMLRDMTKVPFVGWHCVRWAWNGPEGHAIAT